MSKNIKQNLNELLYEIEEEKNRLNIKRRIQLIAVSKTFPHEDVIEAYKAGQFLFGENKIQESIPKIESVKNILTGEEEKIKWHFIGHLQSNKAKDAVKYFDMIHTLDKKSTIKKVSDKAREINKKIDILIQVNTSFEEAKYGCKPEDARALCEACMTMEGVKLGGLMTISPLNADESGIRKSFVMLRELKERIASEMDYNLNILSMGMSGDWRIALREGATHLRIGSAIFGKRSYK